MHWKFEMDDVQQQAIHEELAATGDSDNRRVRKLWIFQTTAKSNEVLEDSAFFKYFCDVHLFIGGAASYTALAPGYPGPQAF